MDTLTSNYRSDRKCRTCGHSLRIHKIMVYRNSNGDTTRIPMGETERNSPLYHLTAAGTCSCVEYK